MNHSAMANTTAYDDFSPLFPIYANSGAGFSDPWTQGGYNVTTSRYVLFNAPLQKNSGSSVCGTASSEMNGIIRTLQQPLGDDNTTVYLSLLLQPQGTLNDGLFNGFFGITLNGSLNDDLFIGKPGGGTLNQYAMETRGGWGQISTGAPVSAGNTTLLVLKAEFLPGNDVFTLYIDPKQGKSEPAAGTVKADLDLGTVSTVGIYSSGAFCVDELRIGTSYGDVVQ